PPLDFGAEINPGRGPGPGPETGSQHDAGGVLTVRGEPHHHFDALLTPRALGDDGDHELQLELYRTLAESGALLVNDVRALTVAIDKFKTSWLLARAGIPTPRAMVTQRLDAGVRALAALGGKAVVKPLYGSLGLGVELLETAD